MPKKIPEIPKRPQSKWVIIAIILAALLLLSLALSSLLSVFSEDRFGNVAVIAIEGPIVGSDGSFIKTAALSLDIVDLIEEADKSSQVKAIIFEINSPGGSAVASDEIGTAIKKTNKTTVAVIREVGASGGYWIASAADHIIANRMSITGSIGVIGSYLELSGLLENYNITYERMVAGKHKDLGTPFKKLTSQERMLFQELLDDIHSEFINEVAENRGLTVEEVKKSATGLFFTGSKAKELGLVDELGDMDSAEEYVRNTLNTTISVVKYEKKETFSDLLAGIVEGSGFSIGQGIGSALTAQVGSVSIRT